MMTSVLFLTTGCGKKEQKTPAAPQPIVTDIVGIGKVVPQGGISELAAPVSGIVEIINAQVGDKVKKGYTLLVLDNTEATLSVKDADARVAMQQQTIDAARKNIQRERMALNDKLRSLNDAKALLSAGATSGEEVRKLQNEYEQGSVQLQKLQSELNSQQAQLRQFNAQRASSNNTLRSNRLDSPVDGTVLEIVPRVGEAVTMYQTYARIAPDAPLVVIAEIDELFANKLAVGQSCDISFPGDSIPVAKGNIVRISPDLKKKSLFSDGGNDLEDRRVREIEVSLKDAKSTLLIDTKVQCVVKIK